MTAPLPDDLRETARAAFAGRPPTADGQYVLMSDRNPWRALDDALAALTETAWIIPKIPHTRQPVGPWITPPRWIRREAGTSDPDHTRTYAAQLLAAADEAAQPKETP